MTVFRDFELEVLNVLTATALPKCLRAKVIAEAKLVNLSNSGVGYFLTVRHSKLPMERIVCNEPTVFGKAEGIQTGFVIFLQNRELTIECHSWGADQIPEKYRDLKISLSYDEQG